MTNRTVDVVSVVMGALVAAWAPMLIVFGVGWGWAAGLLAFGVILALMAVVD